MGAESRTLYLPQWLSSDDQSELASQLASQYEAELATPDDAEALMYGAMLLVDGDKWAVEIDSPKNNKGLISVCRITRPSSETPTLRLLSEISEYFATCRRDADLVADRAQWLLESAAIFAGHVDRLANLPTATLPDLVRWLHLRCAEWRAKVGSLGAEITILLDEARWCGQPLAEVPPPDLIAKARETRIVREAIERLERAAQFADRAAAAFLTSHELLQAKQEQYRDKEARRLRQSVQIVGLAIGAVGLGNFAKQDMWTHMQRGDRILAGILLALLALVLVPVLDPRLAVERLRRLRQPVEQWINQLVSGHAEPLGRYVERKLRDDLADPERHATAMERLKKAELRARELLENIVEHLQGELDKLHGRQGEWDVAALGSTAWAQRQHAVKWLKLYARTEGLVTLLYLDIEPWRLAMPDVAAALYVKGAVLGDAAPMTWPALGHCVRSIVRDLEMAPAYAEELLEKTGTAVRGLLSLDEGDDVRIVEDGNAEEVQAELRKREMKDVLESFEFLRLSELCKKVDAAGRLAADGDQPSAGDVALVA
jgi:hypothetical protein